jgi:hypothetical protein
MARISDGRIGVSVNAETIVVLDKVKDNLRGLMGISPSYTQAIQFLANYYMSNQREPLDNLTE